VKAKSPDIIFYIDNLAASRNIHSHLHSVQEEKRRFNAFPQGKHQSRVTF
jgi:hypothetical protein